MIGPTERVVSAATETRSTVDALGRRLTLRQLTALDKLRLFKTAGPDLALNQPWLAIAILACSVTAIDDLPIPLPTTEAQVEALVSRLGDAGIDAVAHQLESATPDEAVQVANAGNLSGTPS